MCVCIFTYGCMVCAWLVCVLYSVQAIWQPTKWNWYTQTYIKQCNVTDIEQIDNAMLGISIYCIWKRLMNRDKNVSTWYRCIANIHVFVCIWAKLKCEPNSNKKREKKQHKDTLAFVFVQRPCLGQLHRHQKQWQNTKMGGIAFIPLDNSRLCMN